MTRVIFRGFLLIFSVMVLLAPLTSCTSSKHCPAIAGTGNSATQKGARFVGTRKGTCPGNTSTGNYKPKVKNKREDGLMSAKMERQLAKSQNKKSSPIESKKLSMDQ
jgi:hypothetical protein